MYRSSRHLYFLSFFFWVTILCSISVSLKKLGCWKTKTIIGLGVVFLGGGWPSWICLQKLYYSMELCLLSPPMCHIICWHIMRIWWNALKWYGVLLAWYARMVWFGKSLMPSPLWLYIQLLLPSVKFRNWLMNLIHLLIFCLSEWWWVQLSCLKFAGWQNYRRVVRFVRFAEMDVCISSSSALRLAHVAVRTANPAKFPLLDAVAIDHQIGRLFLFFLCTCTATAGCVLFGWHMQVQTSWFHWGQIR